MSDADTNAFMPGFRSLDREVTDHSLPVEGSIPDWLTGSLVRNGPGLFEAGDSRLTHWFDGLAMLRRYDFADGAVRLTNRFLRTEAYRDAREGRAVGQFATDERGWRKILGWLRRLGPPEATDNANVHVARLDDTLVALTEVPRWVAVADDLTTRGEFRFADDLDLDMTAAHLRYDPHAGEHVGFGLSFGRTHAYHVYRIPDGTRRRERIGRVETDQPAYVHDCAITDDHVVLVEVPLRIAVLRALSPFTEGFFEMLDWQPERDTRFLVLDRETGTLVADPTFPPFFTFHAVNAYDDDGAVVIDLVDFPDDGIVDALGFRTLSGQGFDAVPPGRLARYRLPLDGSPGDGAVERTRLYDGGMELPTTPPDTRARPYRYAYGQATDRQGANGLVKVDTDSGSAREWWERGVYVEEPRVVQHPDRDAEDDGVVLAPALDTDSERSMLLVFDATTLQELARAPLPHHHPFGFHGRFFPA